MIFTHKEKNYEVVIIKKRNKNTYIRIKDNCIYITTPYFTTKSSIKKLLEENKTSIGKMIDKKELKDNRKKTFRILNVPYQITVDNTKEFYIDENNKKIVTPSFPKLEKYLREEANILYKNHLEYYYNIFEERIPNPTLKIRKMKSRWGVCNTKTHNITLNLELIHYSTDCLDYVIVHELSHLIEPSHNKKFWNIVEKYYPNYKETRKKLRD